jgi:transcriptional regulator NrdR family protein
MKCPRCKASQLVEIELTVGERAVTMRSCSRCDTRWWDSDGESLPLTGVLQLAGNRR